jgi:hypothetical protein
MIERQKFAVSLEEILLIGNEWDKSDCDYFIKRGFELVAEALKIRGFRDDQSNKSMNIKIGNFLNIASEKLFGDKWMNVLKAKMQEQNDRKATK